MTIERFAGYAVQNWGSPLPGGGYRGITAELDALVAEAAVRLAAEYGRDVVIRFNADRRSGKAFLRDEATRDSLIGLGGALRKVRPDGLTNDEWYALARAEWDSLPDRLAVETYCDARAVPNLILVGTYSHEEHESIEAAMIWLGQNVSVPA